MTNFGKTVRKRLIDLDKTQDWLAAQVEGTGIPCDKTYLSKILNGARKGKQVKAAIEKILDLEGVRWVDELKKKTIAALEQQLQLLAKNGGLTAGKAETCNAITVLTALLHELRQF
jgi:hypothetical protein